MPCLDLTICGVPIRLSTGSTRLVRLFADYFRYYHPQIHDQAVADGAIELDLRLRRELPPCERLIPRDAQLIAQTGIARFWREETADRFYFDFGPAVFRVDARAGRGTGLIAPQAFQLTHVLANTYTLLPLLLLLRARRVYHLHAAAALSPRDELWLFCGRQRSGKTTLATALGLAGWRPISDDSLLLRLDGTAPRLTALQKDFHIANELFDGWEGLRAAPRRRRYLDRSCVDGLECFGATDLATRTFERVDRIVLPRIVPDEATRFAPIAKSEALRTLAEESVFFQIWPERTREQWDALATLTRHARCFRLLSGPELLDDPTEIARIMNSPHKASGA